MAQNVSMFGEPFCRSTPKNDITRPTDELDDIDLRILMALQLNARMSNIEIARILQMTPSPTLRRTRLLEEKGVIRGYRATLDPKKLGFEVLAFVFVGLTSQSIRDIKAFEQSVQLWPAVRECYSLSGEMDFLLKCVAKDLAALQRFVTNTITKTNGVRSVRTAFSSHVVKDEADVPISQVATSAGTIGAHKLCQKSTK